MNERARRLKDQHALQVAMLVCPECSKRFRVYGDAPLAYLVADWAKNSGDLSHTMPRDIAAVLAHEHNPTRLVEESTGLPWLSEEVSGLAYLYAESEEDGGL